MHSKQMTIIKWFARILSLAVLLFGLPFYFGYGNPLPFIHPGYSLMENITLSVFPLMFVGLGLGWKYEIIGGYFIVVPIVIRLLLGLLFDKEIVVHMFVPLMAGILYLLSGYLKNRQV